MGKIGKYVTAQSGQPQLYDRNEMRRLIQAGVEDRTVAETVGCSHHLVVVIRREMGIFYRIRTKRVRQ